MDIGDSSDGSGKASDWLKVPNDLQIGKNENGYPRLKGECVSNRYCVRFSITYFAQNIGDKSYLVGCQYHPNIEKKGNCSISHDRFGVDISFSAEELKEAMFGVEDECVCLVLQLKPTEAPVLLNFPLYCSDSARNQIIKFVSDMQNVGKNETEEDECRQVVGGFDQ